MFGTFTCVALATGLAFGGDARDHTSAPPAAEQPPTPVYVSVGSTVALQMTSKRPITRVDIDREGVVRVRPAYNDQTTILLTGLRPGVARLTLHDDAGRSEVLQMGGPVGK